MSAIIITPPPGPQPVTIQQIYPDTTLDLMYAIYAQLGGVIVEQKYFDTGDDLLYAILKILSNGGAVLPTGGNNGTRLVTGNATWSGNGLLFDVTACLYYINNVLKNSPATQLQLTAANSTNGRIDVIYVDTNGVAGVLTGTPAPTPIKPLVNNATQIELTFILVNAASTVPANIVNEQIYNENIEWAHNDYKQFSSTIVYDNTTAPQKGTKNIDINLVANETVYIEFIKGLQLQASNYNYLKFYVRVDAINNTGVVAANNPFDLLHVGFFNSVNVVSGGLTIRTGTFGFNVNTTGWQLITIPFSAIVFTSQNFDRIYFKTFTDQILAYSLDNIYLQGGQQSNSIILTSQLGNNYLLSVYEDVDGSGILQTTKL